MEANLPPHHLDLPSSRWFALLAGALTLFGWAWFVITFTATQSRWWNSEWLLVGVFALAVVAAITALVVKGKPAFKIVVVLVLLWSVASLSMFVLFALP